MQRRGRDGYRLGADHPDEPGAVGTVKGRPRAGPASQQQWHTQQQPARPADGQQDTRGGAVTVARQPGGEHIRGGGEGEERERPARVTRIGEKLPVVARQPPSVSSREQHISHNPGAQQEA